MDFPDISPGDMSKLSQQKKSSNKLGLGDVMKLKRLSRRVTGNNAPNFDGSVENKTHELLVIPEKAEVEEKD